VQLNPLPPPDDAVGSRKKYFSLVLAQFKKHHPFGNLKFNNLGVFQSLKLRILMGKNPSKFS